MKTEKGETMLFRMLVIMTFLIFIYFLADISFSYLNVCQDVAGKVVCKPIPVIDMLPSL
jgi:hypothetical protein